MEEFWSMMKEMKSAGYYLDMDTYAKLARKFQKSKLMKYQVELYEVMMDTPYKPSVQDCTTLLHHIPLSNAPDLDLVFRVVEKYESSGYSLSKEIYDGIHRSLTTVGRFDEAKKIMETMRNAGYAPDNITYSQLIFGLCKAGRLDEAFSMLDELEAKCCVPDLKSWTTLIREYCMAGEVEKALKCFSKMLDKNFVPDAYILSVLVNGMCGKKMVGGAYTLVISMIDKFDLRLEEDMYKALLQKLLEEKKLKEALHILCVMEKHDIPYLLEPFIDYIAKSGTVTDAKEFLEKKPISVYRNLFKLFFKQGRKSEAQNLFHQCPQHVRSHPSIMDMFTA